MAYREEKDRQDEQVQGRQEDGLHGDGLSGADAAGTTSGDPEIPSGTRLRALAAALRAGRPLLCVIVDTEEEFDWSRPLSRANRSVTAVPAQARAQAVFARFGVVPTYAVTYPVAQDPEAAGFLRGELEAGRCRIGAHLHPWVTPPETETVTPYTSYAGNLPADLERRKLARLTTAITAAFGQRPRVFKAGRYGLGPNTPATLDALGYTVDTSIVPYTSFAADGGPDFRAATPVPARLPGSRGVLSLPLSVGFAGLLRRLGPRLQGPVFAPAALRWRVPGVLARSGLLERIRLSPEGARFRDHKRLTRALRAQGVQVFSYSYHSPSLAPGHTPYVRDARDLAAFLDDLSRYLAFFREDLAGLAATPAELHGLWRAGLLPAAGPAPAVPAPLARPRSAARIP